MNIGTAIMSGTLTITKDWTRYKTKMIRDTARATRYYEKMMRGQTRERSIKSLAYEFMPHAYFVASDSGKLPAQGRQIFYQHAHSFLNTPRKEWTTNTLPRRCSLITWTSTRILPKRGT